ncbi:hypothetical protein MBLNU230_g2898t1 [Neophaeotheca triangularis]
MQGFNRYIPADHEGTTSANRLAKRRPPGALRKDGTQTVRFEMPFATWCKTCKPDIIIGQGVRFNAEKKKVGYYYSTPIWQFRMKHPACGGTIEIRTDPKNTAYVVTDGGKARDYGDDGDRIREGEGGVPILTPEEREKRREDAFAQLEGKVEEKERIKDNSQRIQELYHAKARDWDDPGAANKRLRDSFRRERKVLKRKADEDEALQERLGTSVTLLPESESDRKRAQLVDFGPSVDDFGQDDAAKKPLFATSTAAKGRSGNVKPAKESRKDALRKQLLGNTRAAINPFGRPKT